MSSQNFVKGILLGLSGAGKTSLIAQRNCRDIHKLDSTPNPLPTMLTMNVPFNTRKLKFQIWDTAGQDEMHEVTKNIYHGSQVVFIFTVCAQFPETLPPVSRYDAELEYYIDAVNENIGLNECALVFIINKSDCLDEAEYDGRKEEVIKIIKKHIPDFNDIVYLTSCETGENCEKVIEVGFEKGYNIFEQQQSKNSNVIVIGDNNNGEGQNKKKNDCC